MRHPRASNGNDDRDRLDRFHRMASALAGARRSRPAPPDPKGAGSAAPAGYAAGPDEHERVLMACLDIAFDGRGYVHGGFRYVRLADALVHARQARKPR